MPAPKGNKNAKKKLDWELIDNLIKIGCTNKEIAAVVKVDEDTLTNHCKKEKGMLFSEYIKRGQGEFRMSLRRLQYKAAQNGNVTMLIWLGKQFLGQKDKVINENINDTPQIVVNVHSKEESELLKNAINN
jgi:AraC-like DNA-binding protein